MKPLLVDKTVTDEVFLRQVIKIVKDESERQRQLGQNSCHKMPNAHSVQLETEQVKREHTTDKDDKTKTIQQLSAQIQALTNAIDSLK